MKRVVILAAIVAGLGCRGDRRGAGSRSDGEGVAAPLPETPDTALALMPPRPALKAAADVQRAQARVRQAPARAALWNDLGRAWIQQARQASDPGLYLAADACSRQARAVSPGDRAAAQLHGLVLIETHEFAGAQRVAEGLLAAAPDDPAALGLLSDALLELGRYEEAVAAAQRMVSLKPNLPSYVRAAYLLWLRGDRARALEAARLAVDAGAGGRDPEPRAWVVVQAAMMFWHQGDMDGAQAGFERALSELPGYPPALVGLGRVALARGDAHAAASLFEQAHRQSPLVETAWLLGDARAAAGDVAGAREAHARVLRDGRASDRRTLALFLATKNRDAAEAVKLIEAERAVRDDLYTEDTYAWALYRAGRLAEARVASGKATRLGTPDARLLYHAGAIRFALGERAAGLRLVRRALALNPAFDAAGGAEARALVQGAAGTPRARLAARAAR